MLILFVIICLYVILGIKAGINNTLFNLFKYIINAIDADFNMIFLPIILLIVYILNKINSLQPSILTQAGIQPTQSGTLPTLAGTLPTQIDTLQAQSVTLPTQIDTLQAQSVTLPTQIDTQATQSGTLQAQSGTLPTQIDTQATQSGTLQVQSGTLLTQDGNISPFLPIKEPTQPFYPLIAPELPTEPGCYWRAPNGCNKEASVSGNNFNRWNLILNFSSNNLINKYEEELLECNNKLKFYKTYCANNVTLGVVQKPNVMLNSGEVRPDNCAMTWCDSFKKDTLTTKRIYDCRTNMRWCEECNVGFTLTNKNTEKAKCTKN